MKPGEFPDDLNPSHHMNKSAASMKSDMPRLSNNNAEVSSYASATLSKLELRKSTSKMTNSSD